MRYTVETRNPPPNSDQLSVSECSSVRDALNTAALIKGRAYMEVPTGVDGVTVRHLLTTPEDRR